MREEHASECAPDSGDNRNGETPPAARRPDQAANGHESVALETVLKDEWKEILARRKELGLHTPEAVNEGQPKSDIVGLSLSGGGLRSAFFGLGFVQALHKCGLWRYLDYLSTVSGGGYLGGYLSSRVLRQQHAFDKENFPLTVEPGGKLSKDAQKLIHAGNLFFRPWGLLNKYLVGVLFNNVAFLSALIACAALIALVWRCFDFPIFRDRARIVGLDSDFLAPFWPFWLCAFFWLGAWVFSYFRRGAEAPGHLARYALFASIASLLIGCALLIGNGDIAMGPPGTTDIEPWYVGGKIWGPIVGLILGGLLPFLRPGRLIRSGIDPKSHWEKHLFNVASISLLVGLPLLFIGMIARENVSGYNTHRFRHVVKGDVQNWPAFCRLLLGFGADAVNQDERSDKRDCRNTVIQGVCVAFRGQVTQASDPNAVNKLAEEFRKDDKSWLSLYPLMKLPDESEGTVDFQEDYLCGLSSRESQLSSFRAQLLSALLLREAELLEKVFCKREDRWCHIPHYLRRCWRFLAWHVGFSEDDGNIFLYWQAQQRGELLKKHLAEVFDTSVLSNSELLKTQVDAYRSEMARPSKGEGGGGDTDSNTKSPVPVGRNPELDKRIGILAIGAPENLPEHELKELNRLLLEYRFPNILRPRMEIRRVVSITRDQATRALYALYALAVLVAVGLWVDLNATSMHRFYRNRLASTFVVPHREKQPNIPLSDLDTTRFGSPYHIISGTVGLSWVDDQLENPLRLLADDDENGAVVGPTQRARNASFLFSRLYCGSSVTGYARTEEYEPRIRGDLNRVDLAEAIAMSGAALSPVSVRNSLMAFLMFILNMRLGQWLPNPRSPRPKWRPTVFSLLCGLRKKRECRPYCFITDGGNVDNLGLIQLLKRRCKLIIAVDASCDPKHRFDDLARAIRTARIYRGVKLAELRDDEQHCGEMQIEPLRLREPEGEQEGSKVCEEHFTLAKIVYPDEAGGYPKEGLLVYVKPSFTGDECIDLWQYRQHNESFPHEPTSDQLYDKAQAEAYRLLGDHIGTQMAEMLLPLRGHTTLWDDSCKTEIDGEVLAFEFTEAYGRHQRQKEQRKPKRKKKARASSGNKTAIPGAKTKATNESSKRPRKGK